MFIANQSYLATARVRTGLPFIYDKLVNTFIKGVLARAQHLYPVIASDVLFMANHFHMIIVCKDPEIVRAFNCYLKGEIAKGINKILGRKGSVWEGRTDMPILLTPETIIEKIAYIYTNPAKAGLVDSIDQYPGISSWKAFLNEIKSETVPWIMTSDLEKIASGFRESRHRAVLIEKILEKKTLENNLQSFELTFDPLAWVDAIGDAAGMSKQEARERIIARVKEIENEIRESRTSKPIGEKALKSQSLFKPYKPSKYGQRVFCISHDISLRKTFISIYKQFVEECKFIYEKWKKGYFDLKMPLGAFAPPQAVTAVAIALY